MSGRFTAPVAVLLLLSLPALADVIVVTDDTGRDVRLDAPAQRIVSLAPNMTEILFAAGAGDRIVGTVEFSDHPPEAVDIPRVGRHDQFDFETILALDPDLVVGWQSGNPDSQLERLRGLGFPLYLGEIRRLDDLPATVRRLGRLAGTERAADKAVTAYAERLDALRAAYGGRAPIGVFYQIWHDPLMTINGEHIISDVIRGCGGYNVFADLSSLVPRVSTEAVLARDPEVIVASGSDAERPRWLDEWRAWPGIEAVQRDNLHSIPSDLIQRMSLRILDGMEALCEQLEVARAE